jgi:hypothetical protein
LIIVVVLLLLSQLWLESWTWKHLSILSYISFSEWMNMEKLRWLKVLVSLTLGNFKDDVIFDVFSMYATHLLLGRPWEFDRKVKHDGFRNRYIMGKNGNIYT